MDDDIYLWASKEKWFRDSKGYIRRTRNDSNGKTVRLHRLVMNTPDGMDTDHRSHRKSDNTREQLRVCTHQENQRNRIAQTEYKCVYPSGEKWRVYIQVDGKSIYLGSFPTDKVAALVYNKKATELFGEYASLNKL